MKNKTRRAKKHLEAKLDKTSPAEKAWATGTSAVEKTSSHILSIWRKRKYSPWPRRFIPRSPLRFYRRHGSQILTEYVPSKEQEDRVIMKRRVNLWNRVLYNPRIAYLHWKKGTTFQDGIAPSTSERNSGNTDASRGKTE